MRAQDRRSFLKLISGGVAATAALPAAAAASRHGWSDFRMMLQDADADEAFWRVVKREFPLRDGLVLLNAANLCPSPLPVIDTVTRLTNDIDRDASFQNRAKFGELREAARGKIATYLGADSNEIAITRNTSEGNNTVVNGLTLGRGDEVVVWDQNHPTNNLSWEIRSQRMGFAVKRIETPESPRTAEELIERFVGALSTNTRVLSFSHVSNVSGIVLPAKKLCRAARERGIMTLVDGAQSFGALQIDLHDMGCDFFTSSSHKWLVGPKEAGVLYVRRDQIAGLWANDVGVGWARAVERGAQKFENLGQRDDACVAAMGTAIDFHDVIGTARIEQRVRFLATTLMQKLQEEIPEIRFTTPVEPTLRAGVVIFSHDNVNGRELFGRLYNEHHIAGAPSGAGVRLCPHLYNTLEEVDKAVEAVAELVDG